MTQAFNEQALLLGPRKSLVGVVTKASPGPSTSSSGDAERPMYVILNSGILHRVGANRMSVKLARRLAVAGNNVVRFDLSGIGDSEPRPEALDPLTAALTDIKDALDFLESTRKVKKFVLVGLCSGANHTVIHGGTDDRIVGAVLLEPSFPPTARHYVHHYGRRVFRPQSWARVLSGNNHLLRSIKHRIIAARRITPEENGDELTSARQPKITDPEVRSYLEAAYKKLLERHIPLMVVLTGESWYYRESLFDAFPRLKFGKECDVEYLKAADHVFTARTASDEVTRLIVGWTERTMAAGKFHGG